MDSFIRVQITGGCAVITLDRPAALNALSEQMVAEFSRLLAELDTTVEVIVVRSSGKHFCAGGDIKTVRQLVVDSHLDQARAYFAGEYEMNMQLAQMNTPVVALMAGYTLGGGLGISMHARYRVVCEDSALAMPETSIGFIPDVGSSYVFPRLYEGKNQAFARYMCLTGEFMNAFQAMDSGLATHYIPRNQLNTLVERLAGEEVTGVLAEMSGQLDPGDTAALHEQIERVFTADWYENLLAVADDSPLAGARNKLPQLSPTALVATEYLLSVGAQQSLADCLASELEMAQWIITQPDFEHGVGAKLVHKTSIDRWHPEHMQQVTLFSPPPPPAAQS